METGKPGLANALVHSSSVAAQTEKRMDVQAPLTAVYIHAGPTLPAQPYPPATRSPATLHLAVPPLYSKETLPFLTFHIAGGLQAQPGLSLAAAAPPVRPKSAGKHVCPHCGRDCMKPSVLEKHLRCHTGERPYPCNTCGVSFKTQSNLYKHKRTQAHARLSSESEQGSLDSSRETCTSSLSLDERSMESGSTEKEATCAATAETTTSAGSTKVSSNSKELTPADQNESKVPTEEEKQRTGNEKPPPKASRHLPLQRQEATLFSKQWESSVSRGKSQSHESTDSGFSESSDHYPSPSSFLPEHSMDSLTESTKEHAEEISIQSNTDQSGQEPNSTSRQQEQKILEERISKLISENSAVVEDKQLENVRPRKTVLSKQGSIDLPMPYTYKDSFHFDMKISKTPNVGLQGNSNYGLYSSVPTQCSNTTDHAPLTRSNSLPFSVTLLQPEKSSQASSYQSDYVTLIRRGSSGQINPTGFAIKPVNQQSSAHRPLVRQTAVDCNHATDAPFMNSSVEEAYGSSLSCDGDSGDICGEPSGRKFRRKKAQKFAYNKWYMYGGGTFRKLYNAEKGGEERGRKPEQEAVQGLQKRSSDSVITTGSNFTGATVCHPGCPPAKVSLISALDFNQTNKLSTSCGSNKTPLHRNLSLSVLPLPPIASLVSHKTDNKAEGGRLLNMEKHSDSNSQLSPSDRKKQKTEDKTTDPNTLTHPRPSVAGTAPQQDTNLTYISLQQNQKHAQLKGVLFQPCIINANTPSVSASPVTSTHTPAKTSFLPKYQLKLPNAAETESKPAPCVVDKPKEMEDRNLTSAPSSTHAELTVTAPEKKFSHSILSCDTKKFSALSSTTGPNLLTFATSSPPQGETPRLHQHVASSVASVHRQFAETTITTTCLQDNQARLCTLIQPTKPAPLMLTNLPVTPTITTATKISPAAMTSVSQSNSPLSHAHLSTASDQSSPVNRAFSSTNTPVVPCHIVPLDQVQSAAQKVFHVQTADLQICLQIISDEQLALIEPQIERQVGATPDVIRRSDNAGGSHVEKDQLGFGKESDQSKSSPTIITDKMQPHLVNTELKHHIPEAEASPESKPPKPLDSIQHQVNTAKDTQSSTGDILSPSLKHVQALKSQTSEREHALPLNRTAEEQLSADIRVSQGGLISQQVCSQHKLSGTSLSHRTVNQKSITSGMLGTEIQHKLFCNVGTEKAKGEAYNSSRLESGEGLHPQQIGHGQASSADGPCSSGSTFSVSKCKIPADWDSQTSACCNSPIICAPGEAERSDKHANMVCERVCRAEDLTSLQIMSTSGSEDGQFTAVSSNIRMVEANPAVLPAAEHMEGAALGGSVVQVKPQTRRHGETSEERPVLREEAEETNHRCLKGQKGGEEGEEVSRGIETDEEPEERGEAKSDCKYTSLPETTTPEGYDRKVTADSFKKSEPPEQHLQDLSQTHSGMSASPSQGPQRAPSASNNLDSPAGCSQARHPNYSQLPLDTSYFSQQQWDGSIIQNQQTLSLGESNQSPHIKVQAPTLYHQDQKPDQKQGSIILGGTTAGLPDVSCCPKLTLDAKIPSSSQHCQVSFSPQIHGATSGLTVDNQVPNNDVLDNKTVQHLSQPDHEDYQNNKVPYEHLNLNSNTERPDNTNKYQSFFLAGQLHAYQSAECLPTAVRPVQSCQDYTEDTSSSDDEGKLIIEL